MNYRILNAVFVIGLFSVVFAKPNPSTEIYPYQADETTDPPETPNIVTGFFSLFNLFSKTNIIKPKLNYSNNVVNFHLL